MSSTLSTAAMVAELARRVPIGFTATTAMDALNGAFRWINQQGSFPWLIRKTTAGITASTGVFTMPADFDPGKSAVLYGAESNMVPTEIPFKPWNEAVKHQVHQVAGSQTGMLSCWSYYASSQAASLQSGGFSYTLTITGQVFPATAAKAESLPFVYHVSKFPSLTSDASSYFPTPDHFDYLIVELAESELMRQYRIAGWEVLWKRVTDQLRAMLAGYTTTKVAMIPSNEVGLNAQTVQALRAS